MTGVVIGIDGCKGGWAALILGPGGLACEVVRTRERLAHWFDAASAVAIDVPIGLPVDGPRAADAAARARLGPRRSSVFGTPVRAVLEAGTYAEARAISVKVHRAGASLSAQAFHLLPKVREVDALLREAPSRQEVVREVHPEVSFAAWSAAPMAHAKKTAEGAAARRALVEARWGAPALREVLSTRGAREDDWLDAFACLWTAERMRSGAAQRVLDEAERDAEGIEMTITF